MFGWLKSLFAMTDRTEAASSRITLALEGIADDMETVRSQVRQRFGLEASAKTIDAAPALADRSAGNGNAEPATATVSGGNGRVRSAAKR